MAENQTDLLRGFFDRQQETNEYSELKAATEKLDAAAAERVNGAVDGDVLSVGGVWDFFDWGRAVDSVTVLDLSMEMLNSYCPSGAKRVQGDLYEVDFPAASFDTIVFPLMLHHTPHGNWRACQARVAEALDRASSWLRPGGQVIIVEYCPQRFWWLAQRALFPVTKRFLAAFGQPLVVMYSRHFYECQLADRFGSVAGERIRPQGFKYWTWYPVFMSISWFRMPLALYPKLHVFRARLKSTHAD